MSDVADLASAAANEPAINDGRGAHPGRGVDVEHVRVRNPVGREFTESAEIAVSLVSRGFGKTEGIPVANFTIASTPRTFDQASNEWKDGETLFIRAKVWRDVAENVAASLTMGSRVVVSGRLKPRTYETKAGEKRTVVELEVDEVALSIRYMAATPAGVQGGRQAASRSNSQSGQHADETVTEPGSYADDDPWFGKKATSEGINTDT